jgi:hypothetical protein
MPEPDLTPITPSEILPPAESLQFRRAEHAPDPALGPQCASCKKPTGPEYYQVNGAAICALCAAAIEAHTQPAPTRILLKALLYGTGAAIAGSILYATVTIVTGLELALVAILIGYMVGRAIRHVSPGGRPLQIMAVILTYFSISTSYIPVAIYQNSKKPPVETSSTVQPSSRPSPSPTDLLGLIAVLAIAAPFLGLQSGLGGILSLVIIFFGLQRAWRMTGRPDIVISGPFTAQAPA